MSYNKKAFSDVIKKFEAKRDKNKLEYEKKREKAISQIPELKVIENKLKDLSLKAIKDAFDKSKSNSLKEYKKKSLDLQAQKIELLVTAGLPMDYLDEKYDCKKCLDKGFIGSAMCDCFKKELRKECYMKTKLSEVLTEQNFKGFDLSFYSANVNKEYGISPRDNMEKIFGFCKTYADKFSLGSGNLLMIGEVGLGKTFLSSSIAKAVIDKGFYVIYESAQNILTKLENEHFGKATSEDINEYMDCELLIIDDLGAEFKTQFSESALYNLINTRIITKKPMIISTNLKPNELTEIYHDRIISRLLGEFITLRFFGKDIRMQKLARK